MILVRGIKEKSLMFEHQALYLCKLSYLLFGFVFALDVAIFEISLINLIPHARISRHIHYVHFALLHTTLYRLLYIELQAH